MNIDGNLVSDFHGAEVNRGAVFLPLADARFGVIFISVGFIAAVILEYHVECEVDLIVSVYAGASLFVGIGIRGQDTDLALSGGEQRKQGNNADARVVVIKRIILRGIEAVLGFFIRRVSFG